MKKICVFASGKGSNACNIIRYFQGKRTAEVALLLTNNITAEVVSAATKLGVKVIAIGRNDFYQEEKINEQLKKEQIDFIVLAGFLWLLPSGLVKAFSGKIVNIHPALLPKFGGNGMYGMHIHTAVVASGEKESGITIHYVNEKYDEGKIIFQKSILLDAGETPASLAKKIQHLEHTHYPSVIESLVLTLPSR